MLTKKQVIEALSAIPEIEFNTSLAIEEIILLEKVEEGLNDLKNGNVVTDEDLDKEIAKW